MTLRIHAGDSNNIYIRFDQLERRMNGHIMEVTSFSASSADIGRPQI